MRVMRGLGVPVFKVTFGVEVPFRSPKIPANGTSLVSHLTFLGPPTTKVVHLVPA